MSAVLFFFFFVFFPFSFYFSFFVLFFFVPSFFHFYKQKIGFAVSAENGSHVDVELPSDAWSNVEEIKVSLVNNVGEKH